MNIIVPMAGQGQRFVDAGYKSPKPLIKVGGRYIIDYVMDMFDKENDDFVFICNEDHLATTDMWDILHGLVEHCRVVSMPSHKLGPVHTVLAAQNFIKDDEPLLISYCDNPVIWNYDYFKAYVDINDVDSCIVSHTGFHSHTLSTNLYAYSKTDKMGRVYAIKEKACYTDNRFNEHASSGFYYYKKGSLVRKYFNQFIQEGVTHNGEFYVTLVANLLIRDGLTVFSYVNDKTLAWGTPNEVANFEAWLTILKETQVHNVNELVSCYLYWKEYVTSRS